MNFSVIFAAFSLFFSLFALVYVVVLSKRNRVNLKRKCVRITPDSLIGYDPFKAKKAKELLTGGDVGYFICLSLESKDYGRIGVDINQEKDVEFYYAIFQIVEEINNGRIAHVFISDIFGGKSMIANFHEKNSKNLTLHSDSSFLYTIKDERWDEIKNTIHDNIYKFKGGVYVMKNHKNILETKDEIIHFKESENEIK